MTDEEYEIFVDSCYADLESKQKVLTEQYGLGGKALRMELDLNNERILFFENEIMHLTANIIPIGSFHEASQSWMWGWANDAFGETLQFRASKLIHLEKMTGKKCFLTEIIEADAGTIWELAAIALHELNCDGCYRVPSGESLYFYALINIQKYNS